MSPRARGAHEGADRQAGLDQLACHRRTHETAGPCDEDRSAKFHDSRFTLVYHSIPLVRCSGPDVDPTRASGAFARGSQLANSAASVAVLWATVDRIRGESSVSTAPFIAAIVGLSFEERIAAGPGVRVFRRGNEGVLAAPSADGSITRCLGIISFGIAGGLKPGLRAGSVVVAAGIVDGGELRRTDVAWSSMLLEALPGAKHAIVAGADAPVVSTEAKRAIHRDTGAVSVDMESHLAARLAARC